MNESNGVIRDARKLGIPKMLILGLQHMFAMFGATILVPILVNTDRLVCPQDLTEAVFAFKNFRRFHLVPSLIC